MAGNINLRQYFDISFFRILDDFFNVFLSIKSSVRCSLAWLLGLIGAKISCAGYTPRTHFRQLGEALDLDPPSVIIREMPMKAVEFIARHLVQVFLDVFLRKKVTAYVKHKSAPAKPWVVNNRNY